jgi:DNA mismatch repair protein MutL
MMGAWYQREGVFRTGFRVGAGPVAKPAAWMPNAGFGQSGAYTAPVPETTPSSAAASAKADPAIAQGSRIKPLPTLVANQIAAGEVVERPASVVKELVENAVDAGSRRIHVELVTGGVELVRVLDDGSGIPAEDLHLAVAPHATSKIRDVADLDHIATLGFRGEALASIASVSRLSIRSRTRSDAGASVLGIEGDRLEPIKPAAGPVGTEVRVRNLFFNTPARRKFLRTPSTEQERCAEVVKDLAFAHPGVGFTLECDGRVTLDVPMDQTPRARAVSILGQELSTQLLEVGADAFDDARGVTLWGLAGLPSVARGNAKGQRFFVNGRAVRDRTVMHAVQEAYRGLIEPGRYATVVLLLELSPEGVDVNVHPGKAEVRFRDSSMIHSVVYRAVREALQKADLTPTLAALKPQFGGGGGGSAGIASAWRDLPGPAAAGPFGGGSPSGFALREPMAGLDAFVERLRFAPGAPSGTQAGTQAGTQSGVPSVDELRAMNAAPALSDGEDGSSASYATESTIPAPVPAQRVLQVHKSYLVTQDEQGVVIIDQHALHERVMFEYLLARVSARGLESQRLLAPAVIDAAPVAIERLADLKPLLDRLGLEAEPIGPTRVAVHAFPSFLFDRGVDEAEFVGALLERASDERFIEAIKSGSEESLRDVLDMMACKAAVKAGDRLTESELVELTRLRDEVERSSNCPHGRPTSVRLTIRELDKLFGRG